MANVRVTVNRGAIRDLLRDPGWAKLKARADAVAQAAGPGHEVEMFTGRNRARATVRETEPRSDHPLTGAIDAARHG